MCCTCTSTRYFIPKREKMEMLETVESANQLIFTDVLTIFNLRYCYFLSLAYPTFSLVIDCWHTSSRHPRITSACPTVRRLYGKGKHRHKSNEIRKPLEWLNNLEKLWSIVKLTYHGFLFASVRIEKQRKSRSNLVFMYNWNVLPSCFYCQTIVAGLTKAAYCVTQVIAAVSYQIVPADTQYAEIPLTVVRSSYQRVVW